MRFFLVLLLAGFALVGCGSVHLEPPKDPYQIYRENMPRSILVLPPLNDSVDITASYSYLTIMSRPLGELGYYVFPVAVVDAFMQDNGMQSAYDMHAIPLAKLGEVFGADAVLYTRIHDYGAKYEVFNAAVRVRVEAQLTDVKTEQTIWSHQVDHSEDSDDNDSSLLSNMIGAVISQVINSIADNARDVAIDANQQLMTDAGEGLLLGPLHPVHEQQMADMAADAQAAEDEYAAWLAEREQERIEAELAVEQANKEAAQPD